MKLLVLSFVTLKQTLNCTTLRMAACHIISIFHHYSWQNHICVCHLKYHFRLPCIAAITVICNSQDTAITPYAHVERVQNIMQFWRHNIPSKHSEHTTKVMQHHTSEDPGPQVGKDCCSNFIKNFRSILSAKIKTDYRTVLGYQVSLNMFQ